MDFKCPKCGSENVNTYANKRGALVGKCVDCGKWGNYGKQAEKEEQTPVKKAGEQTAKEAATETSRKLTRTNRRGSGKGPAAKASGKSGRPSIGTREPVQRGGQSGGRQPAPKRSIFSFLDFD
jgi:hypothetical protein